MLKTLRTNFILLFFFASSIVVFIIALSARQTMLSSSEMIESSTRREMSALSTAASMLISAEELDLFQTVADMEKPEYASLKRKLDEFTRNANIQFTYFMRLDPASDKMQFIIDNVIGAENEPDGLDSPQVDREPGPDAALAGTPYVADIGSYSEGWDGLLTAWSPMRYRDGSLSNMVAGVDMQDVYIKRNRANTYLLSSILLCSMILVVILCFITMFLYRRKARQATQASQAKSMFLSRMSHEMRTPLNAIIGLCNMAWESDRLDTIKNHLGNVRIASQHLRSLIDDILDISKIEAGKMQLEDSLVNLDAELANIGSIMAPQFEAKQQTFTINRDRSVPTHLYYDVLHLRQVIVNLLSNAAKFGGNGGKVSLSVRSLDIQNENCNLEWRVKDNGIGIEAEKIAALFQPFVQADASTTRHYGGTGLGLAISKQLIKMMQGDIRVESAPGQGSEFIFNTWIKVAPPEALLETRAAVSDPPLDLTGKYLLLVEDTEINQLIAVDLLEKYGAKVEVAGDGQEGYEMYLAAPERYAVIFMDIQMPVMDGYTCARKIRESTAPTAASIPILAMTANVFREDIEKAFASGMNGHLKKPLEVEQIERAIAAALRPKA